MLECCSPPAFSQSSPCTGVAGMFYLQADVSVAVLQHGHDLAVRQAVHRLPVNTDDPVSHLKTQRHVSITSWRRPHLSSLLLPLNQAFILITDPTFALGGASWPCDKVCSLPAHPHSYSETKVWFQPVFFTWLVGAAFRWKRRGLSHLELVGFSSDSAGLNHGDEDGDVTQRTALPSCYTHPKGVAETLRYTGGRIKGEQNDI